MALNIAIVGSGIAGLSAACWLSENHNVTIYEKKSQLGLGSEGIEVETLNGPVRIDVPPRVINQQHYPQLFTLLRTANVETYAIFQSPSFHHSDGSSYFSIGSKTVNLPIIGKRTISWPNLKLHNITWLAKHGLTLLRWQRLLKSESYQTLDNSITLETWLNELNFSQSFADEFLYPIWSLMCSANPQELKQYPAKALAQIFHSFAGTSESRRIKGGTLELEKQLIKTVNTIHLDHTVLSVSKNGLGAKVTTNKSQRLYDHVIIATEPGIAKHFLDESLSHEKALLNRVPYRLTDMVMHTDENLMPNKKHNWSAINMVKGENQNLWATLWMNTIEAQDLPFNVFQSWDPVPDIPEDELLARRTFHRTLLTPDSANAMAQLTALQKTDTQENVAPRHIWFAGSYLTEQVPLLEDGVRSARVVTQLIEQQFENSRKNRPIKKTA